MPPSAADPYYEVHVHQTGCVATRPDNWHDFFNALAWLAFPQTKARINALHAAEIPREKGMRGRLRDLLTIFDEGGALVHCADPELIALLRAFRWKELFRENRERITLVREAWKVPETLPFGEETLVPLRAGETVPWKLA